MAHKSLGSLVSVHCKDDIQIAIHWFSDPTCYLTISMSALTACLLPVMTVLCLPWPSACMTTSSAHSYGTAPSDISCCQLLIWYNPVESPQPHNSYLRTCNYWPDTITRRLKSWCIRPWFSKHFKQSAIIGNYLEVTMHKKLLILSPSSTKR